MSFTFTPAVGQEITVDRTRFRFDEHPGLPAGSGYVYAQAGRAATVYQVVDIQGSPQALKVFNPKFRDPARVKQSKQLSHFSSMPGLSVCKRSAITSRNNEQLVKNHPDLEYAVIMPWVEGRTWWQIIQEPAPFTPSQSFALARSFLAVMNALERSGVAHGDLSGSNLILRQTNNGAADLQLVDVEQLYSSKLSRPADLLGGTPGYGHRTVVDGLWQANMDRFAVAILVAEMLGWCDPRVCDTAASVAGEEAYFSVDEIQHDCDRYHTLCTSLNETWGKPVAESFQSAWKSQTLDKCPPIAHWYTALESIVGKLGLDEQPEALLHLAAIAAKTALPEEGVPLAQGPVTSPEQVNTQEQVAGHARTNWLQSQPITDSGGLATAHPSAAHHVQSTTADPIVEFVKPMAASAAAHSRPTTPVVNSEPPRPRPRSRMLLAFSFVIMGVLGLVLLMYGSGLIKIDISMQGSVLLTAVPVMEPMTELVPSPTATIAPTKTSEPKAAPQLSPATDIAETVDAQQVAVPEPVLASYTLEGHTGIVRDTAFSPDGRWLATAGEDLRVLLWDMSRPASRPTVLEGHNGLQLNDVVFSPDGKLLVSAGSDAIRVWDMQDLSVPLRIFWHPARKVEFGLSSQLAALSEDGLIKMWDLSKDTNQPETFDPKHDSPLSIDLWSFALSRDGRWLASVGCDDGTDSGPCRKASGRLWDLGQPDASARNLDDNSVTMEALAFSADGERLATGGCGKIEVNEGYWECKTPQISLWDPTKPEKPTDLKGPLIWASELAFITEEQLAGVGGPIAQIWDVTNPDTEPLALNSKGDTNLMATHDSDKWLATGQSTSGVFQLWDLAAAGPTPIELRAQDSKSVSEVGNPTAIAFQPHGKLLAGAAGKQVLLWTLPSQ